MLEPRTSGIASGSLLPTPLSSNTKAHHMRSGGREARSYLPAPWPTPTSSLGTKGGRVTPRKSREGGTLIEAVSARSQWPTPLANDGEKRGDFDAMNKRNGLPEAGKRMATPTARDWKSGKASDATHAKNSRPLSEQIGGSLNPSWVELLMGWPEGWTALEPLPPGTMDRWLAQTDPWADGWEDGTPRVAEKVPQRVARLKCIGNGQVPLCAAQAWNQLSS